VVVVAAAAAAVAAVVTDRRELRGAALKLSPVQEAVPVGVEAVEELSRRVCSKWRGSGGVVS
jgi:hypothetical protein